MAKRSREDDLRSIVAVVRRHPDGVTATGISRELENPPLRRTLQYRIRQLVGSGRLSVAGKRRWARYAMPVGTEQAFGWYVPFGQPNIPKKTVPVGSALETSLVLPVAAFSPPLSASGIEIQAYVRQALELRKPAGYDQGFLNSYRPNKTFYLSQEQRIQLLAIARSSSHEQPAGTYANKVLARLLIDLSWNSSRLEGNTYSLLDTQRLIDLGKEAEGKERGEADMILNHKRAIEFLVSEAEDIGFNRYTILNLHAMLADNLLPDPAAPGRLRQSGVGIEASVFHPLEVPQLIEQNFDQILATASAIADPFEQAFFTMVQLPYLQPFDDVNKRVSRLAANIPFIRGNLAPLSFIEVPRETYTNAVLGVYELNRVELLRDVFVWAYGRSAARYGAVRQSLGEPNPFRSRHRDALREIVGLIVRRRMNKTQASVHIQDWARAHIEPASRQQFQETAETELLSLHEGNFARYGIRPSEFNAWQEVWVT
jgi:Fic/DOC family